MSNTFEFADRLGFSPPVVFENNALRRGFYFERINYKNLVRAIKGSKPKSLNDFDYEEFISKQKSRVEVKDRETEEIYVAEYLSDVPFMIKDENNKERNLLLYGELNKKIANVRTDIYISRINIDTNERKVEYSILFIYEGFDSIKNNSDKSDENRVAIKISTHFFNDYKEAYNYLGYKNAQIEEEVFNRFEMAFNKAENEPFDLAFLYNQAPNFVLQKRNIDLLWKDLDILLGGFVLESKEKAIIKVLRALAIDESSIEEKSEKQKKQLKTKVDAFLYRLMNSKNVFEKLYNKLNNYGFGDNNFTILINTLYSFWKLSSFVDSNYDDNIKGYKGGPETLPYQSTKILGFYNNNFEFQFTNDDSRLKIKAIKEEVTFEKPSKYSRRPRRKVSISELATYNLFHPIKLAEVPLEGELKVPDKVIPAFFLKALDDLNKWSNLEKSILLTVDIVSIVTGIGNLYKLRHLRHLVKLKNVKPVTTLFKVKTAVSAVEVTAGTLNAMLSLSDCQSDFCQKLQRYLFWLELASLGTDVVVEKLLKKSAKEAADEGLDLLKNTKNTDEQDQVNEVLDHLDEVLELDLLAKPAKIGNLGGKVLKASQIRNLRGTLKQKGIILFLENDLKLAKSNRIKNKQSIKSFKTIILDGVKFDNLNDLYFTMRKEGYAGAFDGRSKQFFLTENPTEYLAFHEMAHVKHFEELGETYHSLPSWDKETYVLNEIWSQKRKWTNEELKHALKYVNTVRKKAGQPIIIKQL